MPAGLGWMLVVPAPLSLVWLFCFVDWDKIEPPKNEGGQTEANSVIAEGSVGENDEEKSKIPSGVLPTGENDEEENNLLVE